MSLRAVVDYVAGTLDQQTYGNFLPVQAWTEFQMRSQAGEFPQCWIVPAEGEDKRSVPPRGAGFRERNYKLHVLTEVIYRPQPDTSFRDLIWGLMGTLRTSGPLPRTVTDAVTGQSTTLMHMGESMRWSIAVPVQMRQQAIVGFNGHIEVSATELEIG